MKSSKPLKEQYFSHPYVKDAYLLEIREEPSLFIEENLEDHSPIHTSSYIEPKFYD